MKFLKHIFRSNTTYLPYIQILVSCITLLVVLFDFSFGWSMLSLFVYTLIGGFGISIGFHRFLTHKSFALKYPFLKFPLLWLGCLAGTGSPMAWTAVHRQHHKYSDKKDDPHSPHSSGLKILIASYGDSWTAWTVRDLLIDPAHRFVHNYYFLLLLIWFLGALLISFNLAMYGVIVPMAMIIWASTISNYLNHRFGYVSYKTNDESRNLWLTALLTFGEGWHNNHHAKPRDYYFGRKWWEFDFGGFMIHYGLKK